MELKESIFSFRDGYGTSLSLSPRDEKLGPLVFADVQIIQRAQRRRNKDEGLGGLVARQAGEHHGGPERVACQADPFLVYTRPLSEQAESRPDVLPLLLPLGEGTLLLPTLGS